MNMSRPQKNTLYNYFKSPKTTRNDKEKSQDFGTPGTPRQPRENSEAPEPIGDHGTETVVIIPNGASTSDGQTSGTSGPIQEKSTQSEGTSTVELSGTSDITAREHTGSETDEIVEQSTPSTKRKLESRRPTGEDNESEDDDDMSSVTSRNKRSRTSRRLESSSSDEENPRKKLHKEESREKESRLYPSSEEEKNVKRKKAKSRARSPKPSTSKAPSNPSTSLSSDSSGDKSQKSLKAFSFQKSSSDTSFVTDRSQPSPDQQLKELVNEVLDIHSNWTHNSLEFLRPDKIRDGSMRKPDDPGYDAKTLYVPESYLKDLTPAMRQWWDLKKQNLDCVLFFKVGKFYELYHMDAVVGVMHLGFSYMKGEFAHSGFPESAYDKFARALIEKGYKVARVEQTETPEMMNVRCKSLSKTTKFDKVVKREICQVSSKATCIYSAQMSEPLNSLPNYMYAICLREKESGSCLLGVCLVETSMRTFHLSQFDDDIHFSRLLTMFAEYPPALILTERGGVTEGLNEVLTCHLRGVPKESLPSKTQFLIASVTLEKLSMENYFRDSEGRFHWPEFFTTIADDCIPKTRSELSIRSLGAIMWYLKQSKIDIHVFSGAKFNWYEPLDLISNEQRRPDSDYLILDSITMNNLNLLGGKGSLKEMLDHCETPFGKRLLLRWICRPLCNVEQIKKRQKAISELFNNPSMLNNAQAVLKAMPDLERQLAKINAYGNKFIATEHPDSRAIFYEAVTYSKSKIKDFLKTLKAFEKAQEIANIFSGCEDSFLRYTTQFDPVGANVDLSSVLAYFKTAFDQTEAEQQGKIIPKRGVVEEYDQVENTLSKISEELVDYREEQSRFFGCKIHYFGSDKKRFQLEVPEEKSSRATDEYQLEGTKKGTKPVKRFSTPRSRELLAAMLKAEADKDKVLLDLNRRIFEKFSEKHEQFDQAIQCLTILDVLCSLAQYARTYSMDLCMPEVLPFAEKPILVIENGRYPCVHDAENFVPNDTKLGVDDKASLLIITGPNMGGKSTLMRQIALISIMAQIGSFVPASSCQLSLIDRVFTRLGAQDNIIMGQSTFHLELSESVSIIRHATEHSLVLIDELGRGTSTHDGNAIATAYLKKLKTIKCRTTFATHYHTLVDNFEGNEDVQLGHMACMVENDEDPTLESVTFLYKLTDGRCPKSYGFNAARLAGLDSRVICRGRELAQELEKKIKLRKVFMELRKMKEPSESKSLLTSSDL